MRAGDAGDAWPRTLTHPHHPTPPTHRPPPWGLRNRQLSRSDGWRGRRQDDGSAGETGCTGLLRLGCGDGSSKGVPPVAAALSGYRCGQPVACDPPRARTGVPTKAAGNWRNPPVHRRDQGGPPAPLRLVWKAPCGVGIADRDHVHGIPPAHQQFRLFLPRRSVKKTHHALVLAVPPLPGQKG